MMPQDHSWGLDSGYILTRASYLVEASRTITCRSVRPKGFALGTFEVLWARFLLEEISYKQEKPTPIHEDNSAIVTLMTTLASPSGRTKHLNKLRMTIQQYIDAGETLCIKTPGKSNPADLYTKAVDATTYVALNHDATGGRLR